MSYGWSKLSREEELIISLIREDKDRTKYLLNLPAPLNYKYLLILAAQHRITSLIVQRLLNDYSSFLDNAFNKTAKLLILQHITADKLRKKELIKISTLLKDEGYDVTMMKGFSYDPEGIIPRNFRDVDILIEEEKIREIIALLKEKGYTYQGSFILSREEKKNIEGQLGWNNQYQFQSPDSRQVIEVHTNLFERDRIRLENLSPLLDHPELYKRDRGWSDEFLCYLPCPEASLLLLCLHCSLKRSLGNGEFILRQMTDMEILFKRGIDRERFIALCRESETVHHNVFSLALYEIIMNRDARDITGILEQDLSRIQRLLIKRHLRCMKNLKKSSYINKKIYNFLAPFIIGGSRKQRLTWIRNNVINTKVQQENRYHQLGFKVESPAIYLTYLINPFQTSWRLIKKVFNIKIC